MIPKNVLTYRSQKCHASKTRQHFQGGPATVYQQMSSRRLDKARIDKLLMPWLRGLAGDHYKFVSNPIVQSIIQNAALSGSTLEHLGAQLSNICPSGRDISHFLKKYDRQLDKFLQADVSSINKIPKYDQSEKAETRNQGHRFQFTRQPPPRNTRPQHLPPKQELEQSSYDHHSHHHHHNHNRKDVDDGKKEKPKMPDYYLDPSAFSLRRADQKLKPVLLNKDGQRVDEEGNILKTQFVKRNTEIVKEPTDRRIPTVVRPINREFKFLDPGKISQQIQEKRKEAQIDMAVASGFNIFDTIALSRNYEIPDIDWWDRPFINVDEETGEWTPNYDTVNNEYENATLIPSPHFKVMEFPTIMSKEEQKRIKHITKLEKRNQERLMIKLNLKEKEPQKIKQSQMINFNQGAAVLNPTQVEMQVKAAKEYRIQKHEKQNAEAKLTPEQRREKEAAKRLKDFQDNNINITVFVIENLSSALNCDKMNRMAQKFFLKGGMFEIAQPPMAFVVIEGGPKGTKKYIKLIENRIKWETWKGKVAFQGIITGKTHFYNFKKYHFNVSTECRRFMEAQNAAELFDAAAREFPNQGN